MRPIAKPEDSMKPEANDFNLAALRRNYLHPHALYADLRAHDPIYYDATSQCWLVTAHAPMVAILGDDRFSSQLGASAAMFPPTVSKQMLFLDGEVHHRAQSVMLRPLANMVKSQSTAIKAYVRELLEAAIARGEIDTVQDLSSRLSLWTIAHVLGMPTDDMDHLQQLAQWSNTYGDVTSGYFQGNFKDIQRLADYFRALIDEKRQHPGDDLVSEFVQAGDVYTQDELIANCMMVFTAGRITTEKLLGDGLPVLAAHWGELRATFADSPDAITKSLGEELLRLITPTRYVMRQALEDVDLSDRFPGDHLIHQGQRVLLFLDAADHDPALFDDPEHLAAQRRPNKHIAFGYGSHQCPGANLARIEIQSTLEALLTIAEELQPQPNTAPTFNPNPNLGGATSWPLHIAGEPTAE
jgi:cytochrome P450